MKELSIEEKAKSYDYAIKKAKRMFSEKELNYLFPELAESEDSGFASPYDDNTRLLYSLLEQLKKL